MPNKQNPGLKRGKGCLMATDLTENTRKPIPTVATFTYFSRSFCIHRPVSAAHTRIRSFKASHIPTGLSLGIWGGTIDETYELALSRLNRVGPEKLRTAIHNGAKKAHGATRL